MAGKLMSPPFALLILPSDTIRLGEQSCPFERLRAPVEQLALGHGKGLRRLSFQPFPEVVGQVLDPLARFLLVFSAGGEDPTLFEIFRTSRFPHFATRSARARKLSTGSASGGVTLYGPDSTCANAPIPPLPTRVF